MTIQLDGLGRELPGLLERKREKPETGGTRRGAPGSTGDVAPGGTQSAPEGPVFVDESGRRSRKYRRIGWILGFACACYAVMLVVTVVGGNSSAPWLLIPGPGSDKKADTVKEPAAHPAPPTPAGAVPGTTTVPGPVDVVSTGDPKPRTTISNGVRVTLPPKPGKHPAGAAPGESAPAGQSPGTGTASDPTPVSSPVTGGGSESPPPASPSPDPSTSAPAAPPEQSAPPAAPAPQQRKAHHRR